MKPATRLLPPSRSIALLLAATAVALLVALGCRTTLSATADDTPNVLASSIELDAGTGDALLDAGADHAQRQLPRQPLATPATLVVAILALAAAVATGLRYTISSVPDAGRATSGLRPPPLLLRA